MIVSPRTRAAFGDWLELFRRWQVDIGIDERVARRYLPGFSYEPKFHALPSAEIGFGRYRGEPRWNVLRDVPDDSTREMLLRLLAVQTDTEWGAVEQQRALADSAPTENDRAALYRILREETRHGFQMTVVLLEHFGSEGRREAEASLERRSFGKRDRLLHGFNEDIDNWLDYFAYCNFMDRDGRYQLSMLSRSAFGPLAASMGPMLVEESFHLATGFNGLRRIAAAAVIPVEIQQKYYNKWISAALDLFGAENSTTARNMYLNGLKDALEPDVPETALVHLNEHARMRYYAEIRQNVEAIQRVNLAQPALRAPDVRFNRRIGHFASTPHTVDGVPLAPHEWPAYARTALPTEADHRLVHDAAETARWAGTGRAVGRAPYAD